MIKLKDNNLYSNGKIIEFKSGDKLLLRNKLKYELGTDDIYHLVKDGDRLDLLAYRYYDSNVEDASKYWWILADVNEIMNPLDLSELVGTEILIPNISRVLLVLQQNY